MFIEVHDVFLVLTREVFMYQRLKSGRLFLVTDVLSIGDIKLHIMYFMKD